jgi:hypothetical protein
VSGPTFTVCSDIEVTKTFSENYRNEGVCNGMSR